MTSYKSIFAAFAAIMLLAACAKKEEVSVEVTPEAAPAEAAPADAAPATDGNSADGGQSGGDKVSDPEPPPAGG